MTTIQYLSLTKTQRRLISLGNGFKNFGHNIVEFFKSIPHRFMMLGHKLRRPFITLYDAWRKGTWVVRGNFLVFGLYQLLHKQIARGLLYLIFEVVFIWYMCVMGVPYLAKLGTLGTFSQTSTYLADVYEGITVTLPGDRSFVILLYSIVTIILMLIAVCLWYFSIRDAKSLQDNIAVGRFEKNGQFFKDLLDKKYHTLLLAVPLVGLVGFTVIPVVFMVITGFTNYSSTQYYLFDWVGFDNFNNLFAGTSAASEGPGLLSIFLKILAWTLLWALIATFTNYFLGMIVALLINKKGIKLKKMWRTILILTIAVPQFVSLLLINQMLSSSGFLTNLMIKMGWIAQDTVPFENAFLAKVIIIVVNMWVGVPYTMLICSGILMNIPEDLYESARIDGASTFKMYTAITLPYMLFITGPYLLSQFVGNINNFNIVYLLSQGKPSMQLSGLGYGDVGETDLLITWIYKMSMEGQNKNYAVACVLGLLVFVIIAFFSLIFYGRSGAVKNEGDFQ